jgi:hypothetical protein
MRKSSERTRSFVFVVRNISGMSFFILRRSVSIIAPMNSKSPLEISGIRPSTDFEVSCSIYCIVRDTYRGAELEVPCKMFYNLRTPNHMFDTPYCNTWQRDKRRIAETRHEPFLGHTVFLNQTLGCLGARCSYLRIVTSFISSQKTSRR